VHVRLFDSPIEFLEATIDLRAADPVRTNVIGSIAQGVINGRSYERETWFVAEDGGDVVGAAAWTVPHKLIVSPMPAAAARAIGVCAAGLGIPVPGVVGDEATCRAVVTGIGRDADMGMRERILVLHDYLPPRPVAGAPRLTGESDSEFVVGWLDQFMVDAGILVVDTRAAERASRGRLWLWEVEGSPVSMAGHAPIITTPSGDVARLGPVYTPASLRGHGYGSAITAAVTEHLRPRAGTVMLYTDASNPTSNAIYERLGYIHEHDVVELVLDAG
jgi:GNAT superfamily N-acetyltransferase